MSRTGKPLNNADGINRILSPLIGKCFTLKTGILCRSRPPNVFINMEKNQNQELSFEQALKELETIVSKLEQDDVSLEESISLYERGVKLSEFCSEILDKAELRVEQVNEADE